MQGYRAKRVDGVYIADVLVKDNVGYFLWCACSLLFFKSAATSSSDSILLICIVSAVTAQIFGVRSLFLRSLHDAHLINSR